MNHERAKANRAYGNSLDGSSGLGEEISIPCSQRVYSETEHHRNPSNKDAGNIILE